jgi:cob(I)alamin adenosyltransferase
MMVREKLTSGLVQIYTGNGKGKTSAAFGQSLRAIGRGLKVYVIQFIKGGFDYGELYIVEKLPNLELRAFGHGKFITEKPPKKDDVKSAKDALDLAIKVVSSGDYDIVILDEINVALMLGLITLDSVIDLIKKKPKHVELILTGRGAHEKLIKAADLVTEMKEIKHPFKNGIPPRKGIEF